MASMLNSQPRNTFFDEYMVAPATSREEQNLRSGRTAIRGERLHDEGQALHYASFLERECERLSKENQGLKAKTEGAALAVQVPQKAVPAVGSAPVLLLLS